jgi:hypothetical protein
LQLTRAGHTGSDEVTELMLNALERFAIEP